MTLRELRAAHAHRFHPNQDWFEGHEFMEHCGAPPEDTLRPIVLADPRQDERFHICAATLAARYVARPTEPIWAHYLWTDDLDDLGQRVYLGDNGKGLEIHRHLALTDRWRTPRWT